MRYRERKMERRTINERKKNDEKCCRNFPKKNLVLKVIDFRNQSPSVFQNEVLNSCNNTACMRIKLLLDCVIIFS